MDTAHREPHRDPKALERTRDLMDRATRDSLVVGYEPLIAFLQLPIRTIDTCSRLPLPAGAM